MSGPAVFVFPGQGSQFPGMGHEAVRLGPHARQLTTAAEAVTGLPLTELMTRADARRLAEPEVAQVVVLVWSLAALAGLRRTGWRPAAVAGHSLGEYTALVACGSLDQEAALSLVTCRARAMAKAARRNPGSMAAIVGLSAETVAGLCQGASGRGQLAVIANWNSPRQIVVAGTVAAVDQVIEAAGRAGALRARRLAVGGAYHTPLMDEARDSLATSLADVPLAAPRIPFVSSVTAERVTDIAAYRTHLLAQVVRPVRWSDTVRTLSGLGAETYVEAGPGRVLSGLGREMARTARHLTAREALRTTPWAAGHRTSHPVEAGGDEPRAKELT
ncbi:ACP S-malonyltransferase [Streptomyces sp. NPDC007205]|uniref:ACP S-malonyltransferase n=1 Tax=Streptomyces sp. NPDC007205 TaxID=3154316 RepID=UPI0033CA1BC2